jgi:acyl transferase domain-containing protein/acyl carrier protein
LAQQRLLLRALQEAGVSSSQIGYFETHGTGTALGDPIEVEAIAEVMGKEERIAPCVLGSVKANIGHLEGAAGIAGLIKTVLVMRHGYFPPVAHLEELNPHLALNGSGLTIPKSGEQWPVHGRKFSSISSFGWSGTNAHVVLEEAPDLPTGARPALPILIAISAATPESLAELAEAYAQRVEKADDEELAAISYTSIVRRTHHRYRLAVSGSDGRAIACMLRERTQKTASGTGAVSDPQRRLDEVAQTWEQGGEVDWTELYPVAGKVVSLPQYPFGGRRYWLSETVAPPPSRVTCAEEGSHGANFEERENRRAIAPAAGFDAAPNGSSTAMPSVASGENPEVPAFISQLQNLTSRDRYEQLLSLVAGETRSLFGMPPDEPLDETRGLVEMGMDSLMAVMLQNELQSQLRVQLPATLVLDYPNLASLARFLDDKLFGRATDSLQGQSVDAIQVANNQNDNDLDSIAGLSDAEMDAALQLELAAIRKLGVQ